MAFQPPELAKHEHVIDPPLRLRGERIGTAHCASCGRGLQYVLRESGTCIVRDGWRGAIRFTSWAHCPPMGAC